MMNNNLSDLRAKSQRLAELKAKTDRGQRLSSAEIRELMRIGVAAAGTVKRYAVEVRDSERRFAEFLRNPGHEYRAMVEGTGSDGGFLVPAGWYANLMYLAREYSGIAKGFGVFESESGGATVQPKFSAFGTAQVVSEGDPVPDGPYPVIGQRSWPAAPIYAASVTASRQLAQDYGANGTLETFVRLGLAENIGRKLAPDAATTVYTAIGTSSTTVNLTAGRTVLLDSGSTTELAAKGLGIQTYAAMWKNLDPFYRPTSVWRLNRNQADVLSRIVDSQGRYQLDPSTGIATLFDRPIEVTNSITDLTASTASGPLLLSPEMAFTQRVVTGDALFLASEEARAEFGEMYYRAVLRSSFMQGDPSACVGIIPAAS